MKIVITGALGHIGSYLARYIGSKYPNAQIIMIDNLLTQRYCSLFHLPSDVSYQFLEMDVRSRDLYTAIDGAEVVIHLAAETDATKSIDNPRLIEENNYVATENVVNACIEVRSPLIAISSTSVYTPKSSIIYEACDVEELMPISPYALTKLQEEYLILNAVKNRYLKAVRFRFGTIFGVSPGMRFHTAVNKFCWQACMGKSISVWTSALNQKRPYLDLADAARVIEFAINEKLYNGNVYNVVTVNVTVSDVIDKISQLIKKPKIEFVNSKIMNDLSYTVKTDLISSLGFSFSGDMDKCISETINLIRNSNDLNNKEL